MAWKRLAHMCKGSEGVGLNEGQFMCADICGGQDVDCSSAMRWPEPYEKILMVHLRARDSTNGRFFAEL
jgi:hypothetical protein